jgi:hypothetical protein
VEERMMEEDPGEQVGWKELLENIRRLTISVLDNLEEGSKDKTLDQGQKRLLSSTGSRLLRLWKSTMKDGAVSRLAGQARKTTLVSEKPDGNSVVLELTMTDDAIEESGVRNRIISELLESLAESRKIMLDQNKDLKTRERWTQLHNGTSQILNTVLRDLQMRDWEMRLKEIEEYKHLRPRI